MSIIRSLIRLVDPIQHREEEAKHKRWMQQFATPDPDDGDPPEEASLMQDVPIPRRCRVCGRVEKEARYCPDCLADTLTPI
ncbi:MAG: hypothetical protein IRZ16_10775 [Myxococcaceae bacterium]|nr:hypothetical protein [Myxococcaceae bacterium]